MEFKDRLQKAAAHAKIEWGQTAVAASLGLTKQTVDRWFNGGEPKAAQIYLIADRWGVDPRWLATEKGQMLQGPNAKGNGLAPAEAALLAQFRQADPRWQLALRLLAGLAVEDQLEAASDVNVIVARLVGMKPKDLRYPADAEVAKKLGKAKHVLEREQRERSRR